MIYKHKFTPNFRQRKQITSSKASKKTSWIMNKYIYIYISFSSLSKYIYIYLYIYIKWLIQTNILSGNVMTNSMQATLSKAVIYTEQPTREWGDPYLTWGCANVLLGLYDSERGSKRGRLQWMLGLYES